MTDDLAFFRGILNGMLIETIAVLLGGAVWVMWWAGLPS